MKKVKRYQFHIGMQSHCHFEVTVTARNEKEARKKAMSPGEWEDRDIIEEDDMVIDDINSVEEV